MRRFLFLALAVSLSAAAGCSGGSNLPTVPASGVVTYKGQGVAGAMVTFVNNDTAGKPAAGVTDEQGRFQLKTFVAGTTQANGALPGEYKVTVVKTRPVEGPNAEAMNEPSTGSPASVMEANTELKSDIPAKYGTAATTDLPATVKPSGGNSFNFDLTD